MSWGHGTSSKSEVGRGLGMSGMGWEGKGVLPNTARHTQAGPLLSVPMSGHPFTHMQRNKHTHTHTHTHTYSHTHTHTLTHTHTHTYTHNDSAEPSAKGAGAYRAGG
jgi:hypothetical protein